MSAIGSGAPRPNTSRPSCGRPISCSATSRIASRRCSRSASAVAMSSALGLRIAVGLRQQQARLEIGEPRRHHEIVGGELEPQSPRLLDEGEILVGERQDRNLREIDLLLAREREQQIERALEALDVDDQRRLVGGELRRQLGFEWMFRRVMRIATRCACRRSCAGHQTGEFRARRRDIEVGRRAPRRERRIGAPRRLAGERRRLRRDLRASRRACRCNAARHRSRRASAARAALGERSRQGIHRHVVAHQQAVETRSCRESLRAPLSPEVVAGATGSMALNTTCAVIPSGKFRERAERREIACLQRGAVGLDHRQVDDGCRRSRGHGRECA